MNLSILTLLCVLLISAPLKSGEQTETQVKNILHIAKTSIEDGIKLVEADGLTLYDFGMSIYPKHTDEALHWFSVLSKKFPDDISYPFGVAWVYWYRDDLLEAQKKAVYVLSLDSKDELTKARTHYLLGTIYTRTKSISHAKRELDKSFSMFEALKRNGGMLNCTLVQVDLLYMTDKLDEASEMLKKCELINAKRNDPSTGVPHINYRKGGIFLRKGDFIKAIEAFKLAEAVDINLDPQTKLMAKTNISICLSAQKDYKTAAIYAQEVDDLCLETGEKGFAYYYNCIAWKLIFKCQGDDSNQIDTKIKGWATSTSNNAELMNLFEVVDKVDCDNPMETKEAPRPIRTFLLGVGILIVLFGLYRLYVERKQKPE